MPQVHQRHRGEKQEHVDERDIEDDHDELGRLGIEQGIDRISHRDQVEDLIQKGRDLERVVLSKAVAWHIDSRILLYANKTVIFD